MSSKNNKMDFGSYKGASPSVAIKESRKVNSVSPITVVRGVHSIINKNKGRLSSYERSYNVSSVHFGSQSSSTIIDIRKIEGMFNLLIHKFV